MCNITQLVATVHISGCTSAIIAQHFVQDIIINFELYHLVVIDDGTPFKNFSTVMCDCL